MSGSTWRRAFLALRLLALTSIGSGFLAGPPVNAGEPDEAPLDLAALMLHSDDLDWLLGEMGLLFDDGWPYAVAMGNNLTSIDEAIAHESYAMGRGVFEPGRMGERNARDVLEETGWIRTLNAFLSIPDPTVSSSQSWSLAVAVTIEEFATADGAEVALRAFDDEEILAETGLARQVTRLDVPPSLNGMNAAMWEMDTTWYALQGLTTTVSIWVQVDTLVVSVALIHSPGYDEPDPDLLAPLVELQLKRLEYAEHLYQPGLSICTPELEGEQVNDFRFDYAILNGQEFAWQHATFDEVAQNQQVIDELGLVDLVFVSQYVDGTEYGALDGTLWFAGRARTFVDEEHAESFLENVEAELAESFSDVQALNDMPDLGDGSVAFSYLGPEGNASVIAYVRIENHVFSVRLGSTIEPLTDAVFELAELQFERLESGDCSTPIPLPNGL